MENKNDTIVMKNELINARYDLKTLEELKIFAYAISTIRKDLKEFKVVDIKIKDFMELTGNLSKYTRIKTLGDKLIKTIFRLQNIGNNPNSWKQYTMFSYVEYKDTQGILSLKFNEEIKPYLLNITKDHQYTLSNFKNLAHLSSTYAHRIYLMLKQYQKTNHKTRTFVLADLQEVLQCPKSFMRWVHFNNKVLKISTKEINEKTDINILKIEQHKTGRKITSITIHFELKKEINTNKLNLSTFKHFVESIRKEREGQEVLNPRAENIKSYDDGEQYLPDYRIFMKKGLLTSNAKKSLLTKEESKYFYKAIYKIEKRKLLELEKK